MNNYGTFVASQYLPGNPPLQINTGLLVQGSAIRIVNDSPYLLTITFEGQGSYTMPEMFLEDFPVDSRYQGKIVIVSSVNLTNISHATSNLIGVTVWFATEPHTLQAQPLNQQAVTATATGNPIFTAEFGVGTSANKVQTLNIYNPANSGVDMIFHSAKLFSSDTSSVQFLLTYIAGADLNLPTPVTTRPHTLQANPPVSAAHVTFADDTGHGGTAIENVISPVSPYMTEILAFPDTVTLKPGVNLLVVASGGSAGKYVYIQAKYTEQVAIPAPSLTGVPILTAATLVNDTSPANTGIVEARPSGDGTSATYLDNAGNLTLGDAANIGSLLLNGALKDTIASIHKVGSVSGTCDVWMPFQGSALKMALMFMSNFRDASNQDFTLPTAFTNMCGIFVIDDLGVSGNGGIQVLISGTPQNIQVITSLAAGGGGGVTQTTIFKESIGNSSTAVATIRVLSMTTAHTGTAIFIGN